jgi:hypothetical protein
MESPSVGRRWLWVFLGTGACVLHVALGKDSTLAENVYSRGIFVGLRWFWDYTLGFSPVPLLYIFLVAVVFWGAWMVFKSRGPGQDSDGFPGKAGRAHSTSWKKVGRGLLFIASWAGALVFFFYVLWGFNYNRIGLEKQLRLEVMPLDLAAVKAEAEGTARALANARALIPGATAAALDAGILPRDLEAVLRRSLSRVLGDAGIPVPGRVRVRPLWPGGLLMRLSSTGFYFPYCGEGYIAGNLTAAEKPFVTAHEMVHAYGITDEGAANFLGFLVCQSSGEPAVRYSGLLSYWEYVISELTRASRDEAKPIAGRLPGGVRADIRAARENWDRNRGSFQAAAEAVYERYLRSQGVAEGIRSYDRFVSLVVAWKRREAR